MFNIFDTIFFEDDKPRRQKLKLGHNVSDELEIKVVGGISHYHWLQNGFSNVAENLPSSFRSDGQHVFMICSRTIIDCLFNGAIKEA